MGAPPFDTTAVLTRVRRDSFLAKSDDNWTDANILAVGHDCLISQVAPYLKTIKQDWFGEDAVVPLVANQNAYDFPEECMWNSVNQIMLQNLTGTVAGTIAGQLAPIEPGTRALYEQYAQGVPAKYFMQQTQYVVTPTPDASVVSAYQLIVAYYRRPAQMILTSAACQATVVSSVSLAVTTTAQPSTFYTDTFDTFKSINYVDVYSRTYPYTRKLANVSCSITNSTTVTFTSPTIQASVTAIKPGDWISAHGTSVFPDLPAEGHPFWCKLIAATIDLAQKDSEAYQQRSGQILQDLGAAIRGLSNRQDGAPRKLSLYFSSAAGAISATRQRWRGE